jgi:hypothetical protein
MHPNYTLGFVVAAFVLVSAASAQTVRQVPLAGVGSISGSSMANTGAVQGPEFDSAVIGGDTDGGDAAGPGITINRTISKGPGSPASRPGNGKAKSNPELMLSIDALNHFQQRFVAGHGNQFSIEPPDQGLCVGNGFVLETLNDVLRVFDTSGNPLTGPTDLNSFYGYAPAIDRTKNPLQFGPSITDPSCHFDTQTQRWFHLVLTLDRANIFTQSLSGANHLDIAVSATADPRGTWNIYRLPVQDDGTQGTPDHNCQRRGPGGTLVHGPCLGDYPHMGADGNGFYLTTNEFNLFSPTFFHAAQIYGFPKAQLAAGAASVSVVQFDTGDPNLGVQLDGNPGFTVWPALSTGNQFEGSHAGTEYFVSSEAVFSDTGVDSRLRLWTLSNTSSLNSGTPAPSLSASVINTIPYAVPGRATQKAGDVPLATCLADNTLPVGGGLFGCWLLAGTGLVGPFPNMEKPVDANDSRIQQVALANGKLWTALDTGLLIGGDPIPRAGVAFFVINPHSQQVQQQGYAGLAGNNLTYPAIAVTQSGRGVMAFTVLGDDHYPSAGYAGLDSKIGVGDLHIAAEGVGPDDGFTGYKPQAAFGTRPRWGDYGAAATDGNSIWIASEYINQTCDYNTWLNSAFRCNNTRTQLANWGTRISLIVP